MFSSVQWAEIPTAWRTAVKRPDDDQSPDHEAARTISGTKRK
jgi:hypothetical protein